MSTDGTSPTSPSGPLSIVYCSDEHIAVRAPDDWLTIVVKWQQLAYGADGLISGSTPWRLSSPSVDFVAGGVGYGHVALLTTPTTRFAGGGELYAVDSVDRHHLILRRLGKLSGVGRPPGTNATINGITFEIDTLDPQIEEASFNINQQWGIGNIQIPGRDPKQLLDMRDIRALTVLTVICDRLTAQVNPSAGASATIRLRAFQAALEDVTSRVRLRWQVTDSGIIPPPDNPLRAMRIVR